MKFVNLTTKHMHGRAKLDKRPATVPESFSKPMGAPDQIRTYAELRQQIHKDLRIQHPEWVQPNGECPKCDSYEARLIELLDTLARGRSNEWIVALRRALEQGLN